MLNIMPHQGIANKTAVRYHYTSSRTAKILKTTPNVGKSLEYLELSFTADGIVK